MSNLLNTMKAQSNYTYTENGARTHKSTMNSVLDMFAMGGAYRSRTVEDCVLLFKKAYEQSPKYALKCLFYLRDVRGGGQGERRFFRTCMKWLATHDPVAVERNMPYFAEFGRWDDLYCLVDTCLEKKAFEILKNQMVLDLACKTPSLCAKWLKSENTSSKESRRLASKTRIAFEMDHRSYRKMLSVLRERINIVETLMSQNRWEEISFDKIPSKAGLIYKNAFARRDIIKAKYEKFAKDTTTKVNAAALYPYEVVQKAINCRNYDSTDRAMVNKYWANLTDYFNGATLDALCMVDTSASMTCTGENGGVQPIDVATSIGLYCAERANGPFKNHYLSFSRSPRLVECSGIDFVDKVKRIVAANLCENTNIEAAFDMILNLAYKNHMTQADLPKSIIVISDMEFDKGTYHNTHSSDTLMESIARKWRNYGYELPHLIYWNVAARQNNIPMLGVGRVSFVSGFSPAIFQNIMTGKTGLELMLDKLNSERYACIE